MPDQYREPIEQPAGSQNEKSSLENEILELERKLAEKKFEQEKKIETSIQQEQITPAVLTSQAPPATPNPAEVKADVSSFQGNEKNQRIKGLVDLAFQKGVAHATEVAKNLDSPYLVDEFHDVLIDEFHKALVDQNKLEEI